MSLSPSFDPILISAINASSITSSFVVDYTGSSVNQVGNSKGIGNETDLELLKALRAKSEVVLTSGLTARVEGYKMPRHADLAIFTAKGVSQLGLKPRAGQKLQILSPPLITNYLDSLHALKTQYQNIHVEFGPVGAMAIRSEIDLFVLSSKTRQGIEIFAEKLDLSPSVTFDLPDLVITLAAGRGKALNQS